jgi:hypothetical protein
VLPPAGVTRSVNEADVATAILSIGHDTVLLLMSTIRTASKWHSTSNTL